MKRWLIVPLLAIATPAAANWEYTRWGMSVEDVVKASSGTASVVPDEKGKRVRKLQRLAISKTTLGNAEFLTEFYFEKKKLRMIRYVPTGATTCDAEEQILIDHFGQAEPSTMQFNFPSKNNVVGKSRKRIWQMGDADKLTYSVVWFERPDLPGVKSENICTAVIEAREDGSARP